MKKVFVVFALLSVAACSEDLPVPPKIAGIVPPTPTNFTVTTPDDVIYTLTWLVSDPALVAFYQLYTLDPFLGPVFIDTTATDSVQVVTPIPSPGIVFGVSSVSPDNIESRIVYSTAK